MNFIIEYKYVVVPFIIWFLIQTYKLISDLITTRQFNFKRILGAGGMPSSHSADVTSLATIFAFVVMYDATGVRRAAGKQAKILNKIVNTPGLTKEQVSEKLVETLGHTPVQVFVGAAIGIISGLMF